MWRTAFALAARSRLSILIFHRCLAERDPLLPGEPSAEDFERLLAHVASRFEVMPLEAAARRLYEGTLPARALAITFDDGYANNLDIAAPILKRHGVPATVFVATGYLDGRCMWNDLVIEAIRSTASDELDLEPLALGRHALHSLEHRRTAIDAVLAQLKPRAVAEREASAHALLRLAGVAPPAALMLTRDAVRALPDFGIDVGAHTVSHPILAATPAAEAFEEIRESKRDLEDILRRPVPMFAYPNGRPGHDYNADHVAMAREAGFAYAVSTAWGAAHRDSDPLQLPRFTPWSWEPLKFDLLMLRNLRRDEAAAPAHGHVVAC